MTIKHFLVIPAILCMMFISSPAQAGEEATAQDNLKALIADLEQKIKNADQRMVAHPTFLNELRDLVLKYQAKLREIFFQDSFQDGNYSKNPQWDVRSGDFSISPAGHLTNTIQSAPPQSEKPAPEKSLEEEAVGLLLDGLFGPAPKESTTPAPVEQQSALIYTQTPFSPDFDLEFTLTSKSEWGHMEIILLGGSDLTPRYRLRYHAAASSERPVQIIRDRDGKQYIIEGATQYPVLEDATEHKIQWLRTATGAMQVNIDGINVLSTFEVFWWDEFSGLAIVNNGGTYEWGGFKILKAKAE
ncbi:hypothetical protein QUF70_02920 [Desulfobacterales bacterium HSG17]|nr:hypothetical protein [Desulfobacterales bacterium HSG17]